MARLEDSTQEFLVDDFFWRIGRKPSRNAWTRNKLRALRLDEPQIREETCVLGKARGSFAVHSAARSRRRKTAVIVNSDEDVGYGPHGKIHFRNVNELSETVFENLAFVPR